MACVKYVCVRLCPSVIWVMIFSGCYFYLYDKYELNDFNELCVCISQLS